MSNYYAPDGYRYGVMFSDGSVGEWFNGRTQRRRVMEEVRRIVEDQVARWGWHDDVRVVRRLPGGEWEVCAPRDLNPDRTRHPEGP